MDMYKTLWEEMRFDLALAIKSEDVTEYKLAKAEILADMVTREYFNKKIGEKKCK